MSIVLKSATATCQVCGHKTHQIDSTEERAVNIAVAAMERHQAEAHPELVEVQELQEPRPADA